MLLIGIIWLEGNILKIVIIPAAMKKVDNPYHNIRYPESVNRLMNRKKKWIEEFK